MSVIHFFDKMECILTGEFIDTHWLKVFDQEFS